MNGCIANTSLMGMRRSNPVAKPEVAATSIAKKHPAAMQPRSSSTNATKPSRSDVKFPSLVGGNGSAKKRLTTDTRLDYFETVTKNCYTVHLTATSVLPRPGEQRAAGAQGHEVSPLVDRDQGEQLHVRQFQVAADSEGVQVRPAHRQRELQGGRQPLREQQLPNQQVRALPQPGVLLFGTPRFYLRRTESNSRA